MEMYVYALKHLGLYSEFHVLSIRHQPSTEEERNSRSSFEHLSSGHVCQKVSKIFTTPTTQILLFLSETISFPFPQEEKK